jgi:tetratricopeptide (TPR) repeat protein
VHLRLGKVLGMVTLFATITWAQQQPQWKSREEFDLFDSCQKQADNTKKVECFKQWREKFADSQYKQLGLTMMLTAYGQMAKYPEVIETAKEILKDDPTNLTSLYWIVSLAITLNNTAPEALDTAEKGANALLGSLDKHFDPAKKPATVTAEQWAKTRKDTEILCHRTLSWIAMSRKDSNKAMELFTKYLGIQPNDAQVSYWMYTLIRATKDPKRNSEAFYHLARAASLPPDKGGFPAPQGKQVDEFFTKAYNTYHGPDEVGLKELRAMAIEKPFPPDGFNIKTSSQIAAEKEEEFKKKNPQLAFWMHLRGELSGPNGDQFYDGTMKGAALPGKIEGTEFTTLKGKLVKTNPPVNPKELILMMDTEQNVGTEGEVTLKVEGGLKGKAEPGIIIEFEGVPSAFSKDPFMVTFDVEKEKLKGWVASAAPAPAPKKAAPARKGVGKKK